MKRCLLLAVLSLALVGCQSPAGRSWVRSEIYFGMAKPTGGRVSEAEWRAFVDETITPRFPAGLSVLSAEGQWRGADGAIVREPSRVLVLLHAPDRATAAEIDRIRTAYRERFHQEAVLKVTTRARVEF